ncbi:Arylamine N-acetyltransferase [Streptomyces rubrolavendulae]|uniref:Arylamine N-acetyltransferase n=2 Tax=Streptomyces rubrolavendulae TaxID=285473 RepID=A0A1D8G004_9ACTN|nr:Arylamine N-acetyltransferase [Streptomyces rubrolavendulae]
MVAGPAGGETGGMDSLDPLPPERVDAYLRRIGAERPDRPTEAALRELQLRHLEAVPFENLSVHLREDVVLDAAALVGKVVDRGRGGFCYELNGAFAALLRALGYRVELLQARVYGDDGHPGIPYDHLALRVRAADGGGRAWLTDVGFGDHSHFPLDLDERGEQEDPAGVFRIVEAPGPGPEDGAGEGPEDGAGEDSGAGTGTAAGADGDLDVVRDGRPRYRLERRPRALADFAVGAWWHRTSPESPFTRSPVCSLLTGRGRVTLSGRRLITTEDGSRTERVLSDDGELLAVYRDRFGIRLDRPPVPLHPRP